MIPAKPVLIVGAGLAGTAYARSLAEAGYRVEVIDRRGHIAGNAYDTIAPEGVRYHAYGPHLFHTNNERVEAWVRRFSAFIPYQHRVQALLHPSGLCVPLPINRDTVNAVHGTHIASDDELHAFLARISTRIEHPRNAYEHLTNNIGTLLADLFFRPYSKKMWNLDLEDLSADVVKRIPLNLGTSDLYFPNDRFQVLPLHGYTALVANALAHPNIAVTTNRAFEAGMLKDVAFCFNSMAIDEYFGAALGKLPYRSLRFHHHTAAQGEGIGTAVQVNYTDDSIYTRQTHWERLPVHRIHDTGKTRNTIEEPCDDADNNMERYYPVQTSDDRHQATYRKYQVLAAGEPNMRFIGRCGTYRYLNMDQVINQSLMDAERWIAARA
jgi:UDP-galactopyranose mutase